MSVNQASDLLEMNEVDGGTSPIIVFEHVVDIIVTEAIACDSRTETEFEKQMFSERSPRLYRSGSWTHHCDISSMCNTRLFASRIHIANPIVSVVIEIWYARLRCV